MTSTQTTRPLGSTNVRIVWEVNVMAFCVHTVYSGLWPRIVFQLHIKVSDYCLHSKCTKWMPFITLLFYFYSDSGENVDTSGLVFINFSKIKWPEEFWLLERYQVPFLASHSQVKNFFESSVMKTVNLTLVFMKILHRNSNDDIEVIIKILNSGVCSPVILLPTHLNERDMNVIPIRASR
jgi:hypothetical protein